MSVIEIKDLNVYYGNVCALENANLKIRNKAFLGVIGPNGGGKTTLIKVMLKLVKPTSGEVIIREGLKLGYVPQFASFDKTFPISVIDVVLMGRLDNKILPFKKNSKTDINNAKEIIRKIGIEDLTKRQVGDLSGGQLQKVLIARSLYTNPDILLLDEPSASLDESAKKDVFELLKILNKDMTIVVITHDIKSIFDYIDSIAYVNKSIHYHDEDKAINADNIEDILGCSINVLLQTGALNRRVKERSKNND